MSARTITSLAVAALLGVNGLCLAQPGDADRQGPPEGPAQGQRGDRPQRMTDEQRAKFREQMQQRMQESRRTAETIAALADLYLDGVIELTAEQKAAIKQVRDEMKKTRDAVQEVRKAARPEPPRDGQGPDAAQRDEFHKKIMQAMDAAHKAHADAHDKILALLSESQKQAIKAKLDEMRQQREEMMGSRGDRGDRGRPEAPGGPEGDRPRRPRGGDNGDNPPLPPPPADGLGL